MPRAATAGTEAIRSHWESMTTGREKLPNTSLTSEEKLRLQKLCERIAREQDPQRFTRLVIELNQMLDGKELRIEVEEEPK